MKTLRILCDADDTIENLSVHWIDALNKAYNTTVKKEEVTDWDMQEAFPRLSREQILEPIYRKDFWKRITPIKDSGHYLRRLIEDGHDLYIVTATNYQTSDVKIARLMELFPFLQPEKIIVAHNKHIIRGDVLIDDGVHNLLGGEYRKLLFTQPCNKSFDAEGNGMTRVHSWKEVYGTIKEMCA